MLHGNVTPKTAFFSTFSTRVQPSSVPACSRTHTAPNSKKVIVFSFCYTSVLCSTRTSSFLSDKSAFAPDFRKNRSCLRRKKKKLNGYSISSVKLTMAVSGCGLLCKYVLIIFNILFGLLGIAMFGLGLWLRFSSSTGGFFNIDFNTKQFVIGVTVLILIGAVMVIISAFGDYGACNENKTALRVFYFTVGLLAIAVILAGILAYFYSDKVGDEMSAFYTTVYTKYVNKEDPGLSVTLKMFHNALHCCGIGGVLEPFARDTCPSTKGFLDALSIPACPKVIEKLFKTRAPVVLGLLIGIGVLMFVTMACSRVLMKHIRKYESAPKHYN